MELTNVCYQEEIMLYRGIYWFNNVVYRGIYWFNSAVPRYLLI